MTFDAKRQAWDDALTFTIYELHRQHPEGVNGQTLLTAIINEANDAMARLKEHGHVINADEEEL